MAKKLYYRDDFRADQPSDRNLPVISRDLDSIRAYQFEVEFRGKLDDRIYRLAAKQFSPAGMSVDDITVQRINDKVYYPGTVSQDEITITFDNLIQDDVGKSLWEWFKGTYNPLTGDLGDGDNKINRMSVIQLNHDRSLHSSVEYYGVYPKSWKPAERNYSTNEFHTIEVTFRFDFMEQTAQT